MKNDSPIPVRIFILPSLLLFVTGSVGLLFLFINTYPTVFPRWLFFFLLVLTVSGMAMPNVAFFNQRFPSQPPASSNVIVRQSTWFGLFAATAAWLQIGRVLNLPMALLLMLGFFLIELLLRVSERSQWKP